MNPFENQQMSAYAAKVANVVPMAAPPVPNSVGIEIDRQAQALEVLHKVISDLEQRLCPVLASATPMGQGAGPSTPASPVVEGLRNAGYRIDAASARLNDVLARLEL